jgi:hypothetical protein
VTSGHPTGKHKFGIFPSLITAESAIAQCFSSITMKYRIGKFCICRKKREIKECRTDKAKKMAHLINSNV